MIFVANSRMRFLVQRLLPVTSKRSLSFSWRGRGNHSSSSDWPAKGHSHITVPIATLARLGPEKQ
jgi:hypothetical protein